MAPSRTLLQSVAAAAALIAGLTLSSGPAAADGHANGCAGVTGELIDNGTTVTAKFHVETTCEEVSVLSFYASGPHGEDPQFFLDRQSADDVPKGDYEWTIAAPAAECFRQLDLRVPGRNVDSIVGGEHECSTTSTTIAPTTTVVTPTSLSTPSTVEEAGGTTTLNINASGATSSTVPLRVQGEVITAGAPAELPRTGMALDELVGIALVGTGLGLGALTLIGSSRRRLARGTTGSR